MDNPSFSAGVQVAWDATSLEMAQTCARKYYYRMILNIAPRATSVHLFFGQIYASCLEHYYLFRAEGLSHDDALFEVVSEALISSWNHERKDGVRVPDTGQPYPFDHPAKTRSTLVRSIIWYLEEYEDDEIVQTHILENGKPAVELSFAVEFDDDLFYCGHLDRAVLYGGALYWADNKTSGKPVNDYWFRNFEMSNQFFGYTWAGQIVLHSPVRGGLIEGAYIAPGFTEFARKPIVFQQERIEEWRETAIESIRLMQSYTARRVFPMNLTSCDKYGGCPYKELCTSTPRVREHFLQSNYQTVPVWSPATPR
jgi:hypothetical protein